MTISRVPRAWSPERKFGEQEGFRHFPEACWAGDMVSIFILVSFCFIPSLSVCCTTCRITSRGGYPTGTRHDRDSTSVGPGCFSSSRRGFLLLFFFSLCLIFFGVFICFFAHALSPYYSPDCWTLRMISGEGSRLRLYIERSGSL